MDNSKSHFRIGNQEFVVVARTNRFVEPKPLTRAELEIYTMLVMGDEAAAIARTRKTSTGTVANQLRRIYEKLGVRGRTELMANVEWLAGACGENCDV